jgi:hypothetical protein
MYIRILPFFACFLVIFYGGAGTFGKAGDDSTITEQFFNGHMWQLLSHSQKTIHLTGIQEGIMLCLSQIREDLLIPPAVMESMEASGMFDRRRLLFSSQGAGHIADRIDVFYRDADNLVIPIIEAYRHVNLRLNWTGPEEIENDMTRLKQKYKIPMKE